MAGKAMSRENTFCYTNVYLQVSSLPDALFFVCIPFIYFVLEMLYSNVLVLCEMLTIFSIFPKIWHHYSHDECISLSVLCFSSFFFSSLYLWGYNRARRQVFSLSYFLVPPHSTWIYTHYFNPSPAVQYFMCLRGVYECGGPFSLIVQFLWFDVKIHSCAFHSVVIWTYTHVFTSFPK